MMTRGLPLEQLWMQKRRKTMAEDVAFMNKMVDEIIAERRKSADAVDDKKDMLAAMMTGVDRSTGEQLDDVNIRYQINTFLIAGHETTSGLLSCTIYALLKHPEVLKKAYDEVDRVLGPNIDARPTYQQVTQLTYITQILKEALRLWPPAPAYGISPLKDETIGGGKYKLRKSTFTTILVTALHRDPQRLGTESRRLRSREFQPRGRGEASGQRLEAVRQRPARLHRPRLCHARGGACARHDPAALQADRSSALPDAPEGNADDEARRLQDQGAPARRPRARRLWRSCSGNGEHSARRRRAPPRAAGHNTPLLVLYGSNLGTAEELATRVADLAQVNGFASKLAPLDDYAGKLPEQGGVADLLRLLQRRAA